MPFCPKCGTQTDESTRFCPKCGTALAVAPVTPVSPPRKDTGIAASHGRPELKVTGLIILAFCLGTALGFAVRPPVKEVMIQTTTLIETRVVTASSQPVSIKTTGWPILVTIGQPFIVPMADDIPAEMVFTNVSTTNRFSQRNADAGYIFVVVEFRVKNLGNRETYTFPSYSYDHTWELKVDKGYIYEAACGVPSCYRIYLRPEEAKSGIIAFQILASTKPVEMYIYQPASKTPRITLRL